jgi:hypothetical protein
MTVKPIIFSTSMIRAILSGTKTQTRRVLKWPSGDLTRIFQNDDGSWCAWDRQGLNVADVPVPYAPGDLLWCRETWVRWLAPEIFRGPPQWITEYRAGRRIAIPRYEGDYDIDNWKIEIQAGRKPDSLAWKSPIHMPRVLSRLTLRVTDVRVQRVQEISEEDAVAEGVGRDEKTGGYWGPEGQGAVPGTTSLYTHARHAFHRLWDSINAKRPGRTWEDNPWVAAIGFEVIRENVDAVLAKAAV